MKTRICLVLFLFVAIVGKAQLSNDEKIQMLQTANQSSAVIEKAMQNSLSLSEEERNSKITYAQKFVKRYSWEKMAKETLRVYQSFK